MYTTRNFQTKKAIKEAIAAGEKLEVYQPNNFFGTIVPKNGKVTLEGPHYPQPHKWYATAILEDGYIKSIK